MTEDFVIGRPQIQQIERRGQRVIRDIYSELIQVPEKLIPSWDCYDARESKERRVCDFIAGMTDLYAERTYMRLFTPGFGTSRDDI
jgi:dGTPase